MPESELSTHPDGGQKHRMASLSSQHHSEHVESMQDDFFLWSFGGICDL